MLRGTQNPHVRLSTFRFLRYAYFHLPASVLLNGYDYHVAKNKSKNPRR